MSHLLTFVAMVYFPMAVLMAANPPPYEIKTFWSIIEDLVKLNDISDLRAYLSVWDGLESFDINEKRYINNGSILFWPGIRDRPRVIQILANYHATNVTLQDKHGNTALHVYTSHGNFRGVKAILANSSINVQNERGETALMLAMKHSHFDIAQLMVEEKGREIDWKLRDLLGLSVIDWLILANASSHETLNLLDQLKTAKQSKKSITWRSLFTIRKSKPGTAPNLPSPYVWALLVRPGNGDDEVITKLKGIFKVKEVQEFSDYSKLLLPIFEAVKSGLTLSHDEKQWLPWLEAFSLATEGTSCRPLVTNDCIKNHPNYKESLTPEWKSKLSIYQNYTNS